MFANVEESFIDNICNSTMMSVQQQKKRILIETNQI